METTMIDGGKFRSRNLLFSVPDPKDGLSLWIDEERKAWCLCDDDAVLNGERIFGQSFVIPFCDGRFIRQEINHTECRRDGDGNMNKIPRRGRQGR